MTCFHIDNAVVCTGTEKSKPRRRMLRCPTCRKRRAMFFHDYEVYGPLVVCLTCGESWSGGEMMPRPFAAGWRRKSVEAAKKRLEMERA